MNWYFKVLGGHTHVAVFMNGGKCGDLVFRNEEFNQIRATHDEEAGPKFITFIPQNT